MKNIMLAFEKHLHSTFQLRIASKLRACFCTMMAMAFLLVSPMTSSAGYTADTTTSPSALTGLWNNQNESGWGVTLTQQYDVIFATLFVYDGAGNPVWYVASNCAVSGGGCQGDLYKVTGGSSPTTTWNGTNPATTVGTITLTFADNDNGTMNYTIDGLAGSKAITRQVWRTASPTNTADRSCTGSMAYFTFNITIHPSAGTIAVSMTGTTNTSFFAPHYVSVIQGNNSVTGTSNDRVSGALWTGDAGFQGGSVPTGVNKSGTFSGFPSWFDFSQPFTVNNNITGEQIAC